MTAADRPSVTPQVGDTITTAEQLDALPSLTIVVDANEEVQQRHGHLTTQDGDYSAWLGVMPLTCKPSPEVALPATVLYVPGEQPCRHCGSCDGPPSCPDCDHADALLTHARAEAWRRFPDGIDVETGEPVDDYGYPATAREAFIGGAEWAAGRAEMTTATTEDAVQVIHQALQGRWVSVLRVLQEDDDYPAMLRHVVRRLADAGLLATARTHPTRDDLARAIASGYETDHPTPNRHDYRAADAVLALLRDGALAPTPTTTKEDNR